VSASVGSLDPLGSEPRAATDLASEARARYGVVVLEADAPLELLDTDDRLVVVGKPSGALVVNTAWAGPPERTVLDRARAAWGAELVPVHRLDRGTSGVLLLARGGEAAEAWQRALAAEGADKTYLALVRGACTARAHVDHALADERGRVRPASTDVAPLLTATPSVPTAEETGSDPRVSWVIARPRTGRTHQVRRHLKHLGHPILGDAAHGRGQLNRAFARHHGLDRLALHAWSITLDDPWTGARRRWVAPIPTALREVLLRLFPTERLEPEDDA
jgi:tRNA pseudouridine65 synthase